MPRSKPSTSSPKRITHQDIADALGVSKTTVSLALRNHPRITAPVRAKVHAKSIELGYAPDPMLSALAKYRKNNQDTHVSTPLAWINLQPDPKTTHQAKEFVQYLKGAKEAAAKQGFTLDEFAVADLRPSRLDSIFRARNIKGLLLSPPDFSYPVDWGDFPWQDYATVRFGRSETFPLTHFVTSAQSTNAMIAFDAIQEKGYKRIGFVTDHRRRRTFGAGYFWAQFTTTTEDQIPILNLARETSEKQKSEQLDNWIQTHKPDAILSDIASSMPELLKGLGHKIPTDIALATTSILDSPINAGIDQRPEEIGRTAIRTLTALLNEQTFGIPKTRNEILIEGQWIHGSMLPNKIP